LNLHVKPFIPKTISDESKKDDKNHTEFSENSQTYESNPKDNECLNLEHENLYSDTKFIGPNKNYKPRSQKIDFGSKCEDETFIIESGNVYPNVLHINNIRNYGPRMMKKKYYGPKSEYDTFTITNNAPKNLTKKEWLYEINDLRRRKKELNLKNEKYLKLKNSIKTNNKFITFKDSKIKQLQDTLTKNKIKIDEKDSSLIKLNQNKEELRRQTFNLKNKNKKKKKYKVNMTPKQIELNFQIDKLQTERTSLQIDIKTLKNTKDYEVLKKKTFRIPKKRIEIFD
jgi:hypothetical protein